MAKFGTLKACLVSAQQTTIGMAILVLPVHKVKYGMTSQTVAVVLLAKTGTDSHVCPAMVEGHGTPPSIVANALEDSTGTALTASAAQMDQTGTDLAASLVHQVRFGTQQLLLANVHQDSNGMEQPASLLALQE